MAGKLEARVAGALTNVRNPRVENDIISAGMVEELSVTDDGVVSFTFVLSREDPAGLVRAARQVLKEVDGVTDVKIRIIEPRGEPASPQPAGRAPVSPPSPPQPKSFPDLGTVIAVSSGKGGVGKSTVSTNLAAALSALGNRVGLMDADIYGPNVPRMFGIYEKPPIEAGRMIPVEAHGVKLISLGFLVDRDTAAIWRGPIVTKIIQQFVRDVDWGKLDFLIVDLPPGTGDAQLSLVQSIQVDSAIIVTTPQQMAAGDALRGAKMFDKVGVPVVGIVENMSGFVCPHCNERTEVFKSGGGAKLAAELDIPLLGQVPLQAGMTEAADSGKPIVVAEPESPAAMEFKKFAERVKVAVGGRKIALPVIRG